MPSTTGSTGRRLDRESVIIGAIELADQIGVDDLTIRKLADHLGSKPMSLYHHVANKDAILDAMVDAVYAEIGPVEAGTDWRPAIRARCVRMRDVFRRHRWAVYLVDSRREPGMATLSHHDATISCLYAAGFDDAGVSHTVAFIDAFVLGFAVQEASLPATSGEEMDELVESIAVPADVFPGLARFTNGYVMGGEYDFGAQFDEGLDLVLDGIEHRYAPR